METWVNSDTFTPLDKAVPLLDAIATCDEAMQKWSVALVNRHPDTPLRCQVVIGGQAWQGPHKVTVLCGDSPDAYNDLEAPDRVSPSEAEQTFEQGEVELPAHSVTVIQTLESD